MHVIDLDRPALCLQHVFQLVVRHSNDITLCVIILQHSDSDGRKCGGTLWTRYASVAQLRTQGEWREQYQYVVKKKLLNFLNKQRNPTAVNMQMYRED